jgi:hypothetical protein
MPNTNPQAISVANNKIRPAADRIGQLYNLFKALQAEYAADNWGVLFPADNEIIVDGSEIDGRTPITNNDVRTFILTVAAGFITTMEASANAQRNNILKIAVNPERIS